MSLKSLAAAALAGVALVLAPAASAETLYEALGERPGLVRIVDDLIALNLADPRIAHQFDNIAFPRLKGMIVDQFCELSGGPCKYAGRDMHASHKGLHLTTADFNALVENLQTAMDRSDIPFRTQNRLLALLAPMWRDVVTR